ncbi:MAG: hypothetical protein ACRD3W_23410, partial [Terriglobales bacterium]
CVRILKLLCQSNPSVVHEAGEPIELEDDVSFLSLPLNLIFGIFKHASQSCNEPQLNEQYEYD